MEPKAVVLVESEEDIAAYGALRRRARYSTDAACCRDESDRLSDRVGDHSGCVALESGFGVESRRALGSGAAGDRAG
jgi:hypothetical protein